MAKIDNGLCDACGHAFAYQLIHNGFNDTAFAYCDRCGSTALLSGYFKGVPPAAKLAIYGPVNAEAEGLLKPCACGGSFRHDAAPRCPHCNTVLSAEKARAYIEKNAPGTSRGWRWQGSWSGLYCIIVEGRSVENNWEGT
jgi:hypothetical protein